MKYEITGSDVTEIEPVNGVIYVAGIVKTPTQLMRIKWEMVGLPGETICQADCVQYEIDCLAQTGHKILSLALY